jgi:hypothetical protein
VPLFCEVDPGLWANGGDPERFLRQAQRHFSHFIPATALTGRARPQPAAVAKLPAFCRSLGPLGSDVLLFSEGRTPRKVNLSKR